MDPTVSDLIAFIVNAGPMTLAVIFIVALFKDIIITKSNHQTIVEMHERGYTAMDQMHLKRYADLEERYNESQEQNRELFKIVTRSSEVIRQVVPAAIEKTTNGKAS